MNHASQIISKFGGASKAARALGCAVTTVQSWEARGAIPPGRGFSNWQRILDRAAELKLKLTREDFVSHLREGPSRRLRSRDPA
jgi:hypothetical protein